METARNARCLLAGAVVLLWMGTGAALGATGPGGLAMEAVPTASIPISGDFSPPAYWPDSIELPRGVGVLALDVTDGVVTVALSQEILAGFEEATLAAVFDEVRALFALSPEVATFRLTCDGKLLSSFLAPAMPVEAPAPSPTVAELPPTAPLEAMGLSGRNITIGPSHGRYWNSTYGWLWQRGDPCGFGEAVLEDTNSIRLCQFLNQYLTQDGATVHVPRQLTESDCCSGDTGLAWWKMCAESWLHHAGLPCSVWASYSGNCGGDSAADRSSDDIRARPLFADYRGSNIYIACHTNAGGGGTANGTETFRDTAMEHPAHEANSYTLASDVQSSVISAIREMYDGSWANRGVKDSAGGFGEIRIPDRPAILIELAFHDNCSRDAAYLTDNFFRSVAEWGLYRGVCQYFGTSPTWDRYSDEYVSDTIPTTMTQGQSYNVNVVFRNRGVVWTTARDFRLGAAGDSDPFVSFTRRDISGEVRPGNTYTFSFTMTAPAPGEYVSDWRMVRDGVAWFGATATKNVHVNPSIVDTEPPTTPTGLTATATSPTSVQLNWTASTDNIGVAGYDVRRNGSVIGSSATNSYTDNAASANSAYTYEVRAKDSVPNYSEWSDPAYAITPVAPVVVFSDGFNGNLANWTQQTAGFAYSTTVSHASYTGAGAAYCAAGEADQMYHTFTRPFAQGKGSGWFYDGKGGWQAGVCGLAYRQAMSLRTLDGSANMFIDNEFYSASDNSKYFYRLVGAGGVGHTAYATRNPGTTCGPAWVYFETAVTPGAPGASPTGQFVAKVTDGAGTTTVTHNLTTDFFNYGLGRITLGLGVTSVGESYWDDIAFEAMPPNVPTMGTPTAMAATQIKWNFSPADNNVFGFNVADAAGSTVSPLYPASGWLKHDASSWTESGLEANTSYTRKVKAWNGSLDSLFSGTASAYTLSVPPGASSVTPDKTNLCPGENVTWTAAGGFGPGTLAYYRYAWDQNATYAFTESEPTWSSGTLVLEASPAGGWYLHVKGYNAADVANGTFDYSVTAASCSPPAITGAVSRKVHGDAGPFDIDVSTSSAIEPRSGGPTTVLVTFDQSIQGIGGLDVSDVTVSTGSVSNVAINGGTELEITMAGAADGSSVTIGFSGIESTAGVQATGTLCFGVLLGDLTTDGSVNIFDLVTVRNALNLAVTNDDFRNDVTADGAINIFDLVTVRNNLNQVYENTCP